MVKQDVSPDGMVLVVMLEYELLINNLFKDRVPNCSMCAGSKSLVMNSFPVPYVEGIYTLESSH